MVYCHFALRNTAMFRKVTNMNGLYTISNPNTATTNEFNSDYNSFSDVEYFEVGPMSLSFTSVHCPQVYSPPISTKYSEVYWTMMDPVALDKDLVARFQGKTMAIVGYETDQVIVTEGQPDVSVPITHAYNHHFEVPRCYLVVNLVGLSFRLTLRDEEGGGRGGCGSYGQGHEQPWRACVLPHIQVGSCKSLKPIILCPTQT